MRRTIFAGFWALLALLAPALRVYATNDDGEIGRDELLNIQRRVQAVIAPASERTVAIRIKVGSRDGYGSGAIITPEGHVLTCAHVSEPGEKLTVILASGRELEAQRLGKNSHNDYSLVKIEAGSPLPFFELGDSDALTDGQWVVALGHPGGPYGDHRPTSSVGRITGKHRKLPVMFNQKFYDDALQTDAPLYGGNSGGPLIDLDGRLIGINGAILMIGDAGFATPINEIKADLEALKRGEELEGRKAENMGRIFEDLQKQFKPEDLEKMFGGMGKLFKRMFGGDGEGNPFKLVDPKELEKLMGGKGDLQDLFKKLFGQRDQEGGGDEDEGLPEGERGFLGLRLKSVDREGALIADVQPDGPAAGAGIKPGDVVCAVEGKKITSEARLSRVLSRLRAGQKVRVSVRREGWEKDFEVVLGQRMR